MVAYNNKVDSYQREFTNKLDHLVTEKQRLKRLGLEFDLEAKDGASKLVHARCVIRELEIDILKVQYRLERAHVQIAKEKSQSAQLKADSKYMKKQIKKITEQRDALHKSSLALVEYLNAASLATKSINKECILNKSNKTTLEKQNDILKSNILEQSNKIVHLQQQNKDFQTNLDKLEKLKEQDTKIIQELSKEYQEFKTRSEFEKGKYEKDIAELKRKCKSQSQQLHQLEKKEAEEQQAKISEELATLQKQVEELCQKKNETENEMLSLKNDTELQKSRLAKQELKLLLAEKELKIQKLKQKADIVSIKERAEVTNIEQIEDEEEEMPMVDQDEGDAQVIESKKRTRNVIQKEENMKTKGGRMKRVKTVASDPAEDEEQELNDEADQEDEDTQPTRRSSRRTRKLLDVREEKDILEADENIQTQERTRADKNRRKNKW
eukprot:CAMPEP_0204822296 /NCGR_PEP_ID=MMETSP1346-20131115/474_1 /ASSEMBLY_ACC=CAM_ASM_000771 /TAXON_ID=215587 /ORGANISM="Aplanochytrium stocchinoi, Strain GSBS06" /LENGTH=438 /DNA_ID=CAMNT_0051948411 /DNA_START=328 /DNA_END=1641 /DNA_ORIENTATION=-